MVGLPAEDCKPKDPHKASSFVGQVRHTCPEAAASFVKEEVHSNRLHLLEVACIEVGEVDNSNLHSSPFVVASYLAPSCQEVVDNNPMPPLVKENSYSRHRLLLLDKSSRPLPSDWNCQHRP